MNRRLLVPLLAPLGNAYHQATDFGFKVVQRPRSNPFPNQVFAPER